MTITKRNLSVFGVMVLALALSAAVLARAEGNFAATSIAAPDVKPLIVGVEDKDLRQELSIKENVGKGRVACMALGVCPAIMAPEATEVLIKAAKVNEVGADFLRVSIFGYAYKVDTTAANIVRHYWGASNLGEFSAGDIVNVHGYLDGGDNYLVHAKTVRNVSIQKVHSVFNGSIESVDAASSSFVFQTQERGKQTVYVSADTQIVLEGESVVCVKAPCPMMPTAVRKGTFADLQPGMKAVVRGLWDKTLSTIRARSIIVGGALSPRLFFKEEIKKEAEKENGKNEAKEKELEKLEKKLEKKTENLEKPGEKEGILKRIDDLQKMILEIQKKIGASSGSPSTGAATQ